MVDKNLPKFRTKYNSNLFPKSYEKHDETCITERAGYLTTKQRIENLMVAGQRLVNFRKQQFDFPDGEIDHDFDDPTRNPNFDMSDASQLQILQEKVLKHANKIKSQNNTQNNNSDNMESDKEGNIKTIDKIEDTE